MREIRLVRFTALIVAVLITLVIPVSALETVDIKNISIKQTESGKGIVTVKVYNPLPDDKDFTLLLTKNNDFLADTSNVFAIYDEYEAKLGANNEIEFVVDIRDIKMNSDGDSVSAKGEYKITFRNGAGEKDEYTFFYASAPEIHSFISNLQTAISQVTDDGIAYEKLDDVICVENRAEMFSVEVDFSAYKVYIDTYGEDVGNRVLNSIYKYGKTTAITKDNFADAFNTAFAMEIFNRENKKLDATVLNVPYGDGAMDTTMYPEIQTLMEDSYSDVFEFQNVLRTMYGISCVNHSTMTDVSEVLDEFKKATGKCVDEINAIQGLGVSDRYEAYEHIILQKTSTEITSLVGLQTLLKNAYNDATAPSPSGGGTGTGGGSLGTASNKTSSSNSNPFASVTVETTSKDAAMIFTDLSKEHWAAESVQYLKEKGIVNGTNTGAFEPDRMVTREEFTKMLILAFGVEEESVHTKFEDVTRNAWYLPYIGAAVKHGIVNGIDETRFGVGQNISRQDMAVMVARAVESFGKSLIPTKEYTAFGDETEIADYAKNAVLKLTCAGILNGKGGNLFAPKAGATRAEAAKIIFEVIGGK